MKEIRFKSYSVSQTIDFARMLSRLLKKGDVIGLVGNLGSGKTTFVRGVARGLGLKQLINSPSFVVLKIYTKKITLYHFDLYRVQSLKDLEDIGYEDFVSDSGICVIEWANKAKQLLPKEYLKVRMEIKGPHVRTMRLTGYGHRYHNLMRTFAARLKRRNQSKRSRKKEMS